MYTLIVYTAFSITQFSYNVLYHETHSKHECEVLKEATIKNFPIAGRLKEMGTITPGDQYIKAVCVKTS